MFNFDFLYKVLSKELLILRRIRPDIIINVHSTYKYPLFLSGFNTNQLLSTFFRNIFKYEISRKFVQWEPSCFVGKGSQRDRQTDGHDKVIVAFLNFSKTPKYLCHALGAI